MTLRLLVVEDNPSVADALEQGLSECGFNVEVTASGHDGEARATSGDYDVLLVDLMLPDQDGLTLCRNLRRRGCATPLLVLSALHQTKDKVASLEAGADDYLTKPVDHEELVARLRALARRGFYTESSVLQFADLHMDLQRRSVTRAGRPISLTRKQFALLEYLMRHPERVLTRANIGEHVWDMNFDPYSNVIDVYVSMLRSKIDKPFKQKLIQTVIGSGYMLSNGSPSDERHE
jgi:DNA-binding response OmpR family regulator